MGLDGLMKFSVLDDIDRISGLEERITFSELDDDFSGPEGSDNSSISHSMGCFSGMHELSFLYLLNDSMDDLDNLAATHFLILKI